MKVISICLTDLPKDKITVGKNGKKYISIVVDDRREKDQFGNDQTVYVNQTKEERAAKEAKTYVGQGKTYEFNKTVNQATSTPAFEDDDLPF